MYLAELPWRRGCSVIRGAPRWLFSFLSVFSNKSSFGLPLIGQQLQSCDGFTSVSVHKIYFSTQVWGAPLNRPSRSADEQFHNNTPQSKSLREKTTACVSLFVFFRIRRVTTFPHSGGEDVNTTTLIRLTAQSGPVILVILYHSH